MVVRLTNIIWDNENLLHGDRQNIIDDYYGELNEDNVEKFIQDHIDDQPSEYEIELDPKDITDMEIMSQWDYLSDHYSPCGLQAIVLKSDIEIDGKKVSLSDLPCKKIKRFKIERDLTNKEKVNGR